MSTEFDPSVFEDVTADTADLEILHPVTGEPTGWVWTFAGPGHPQQQAVADRLMRKALHEQREIDAARAKRNGKYKPEAQTPEQIRLESAGNIADQVVTWTGSTIPFSRDAAVGMLVNPKYADLFRQVTEFLERETAFYQGLRDGLIAFVEHEAEMTAPVDKSGATLRESLIQQLERAEARNISGAKLEQIEAQLAGPDLPPAGVYLWSVYRDLADERDYAGMGQPMPIKSRQILDWCQVHRRRLAPWEASLLKDMDRAFLAVRAKADEAEGG